MRDPVSHQCPKTRSDALDEATQTRHAKRPDHYLCDTVEQLFTHLSSLGVKWSPVQVLSDRRRPEARFVHAEGASFTFVGPLVTPLPRRDISLVPSCSSHLSGQRRLGCSARRFFCRVATVNVLRRPI